MALEVLHVKQDFLDNLFDSARETVGKLQNWLSGAGRGSAGHPGNQAGPGHKTPSQLLTLRLFYKDKPLDTIRQHSDFTYSWFIGRGKHIFWQILNDKKFPLKHKLLALAGNEYHLQLPPAAIYECNRNGMPVDNFYLNENGILNGTDLLLRPDMDGTVQLNRDYKIQYFYARPQIQVLTSEQRKVVGTCLERSQPDAIDQKDRKIIFLLIALSLAFIMVYDIVIKPKPAAPRSLSSYVAEMERARRIEVEAMTRPQPGSEIEQPAGKAEKAPAGQGTRADRPSAGTGRGGRSPFGNLNYGYGSSGSYDNTYLSNFVTLKPGSFGWGSSSGAGPGSGTGGIDGSGNGASYSAGGGYQEAYDPNAPGRSNLVALGKNLVFGPPPGGGGGTKAAAPKVAYTGDTARLEEPAPPNRPIPRTPGVWRIIQTFDGPTVAALSESSILGSSTGKAADTDNVYDQLKPKRNQIMQAYRRSAAQKSQSGSISVMMYISENGSVVADITPNGSFSPSFLQDVRSIVENWSFSVSKKTKFQFNMRLMQG